MDCQFDGEWIMLSAYEKVKVDKEQENNIQKDKYCRSLHMSWEMRFGNQLSYFNWSINKFILYIVAIRIVTT